MRKLVDVDTEGLESLLGEDIMVWSLNYIYAGKLVGVNDTCIRLDDAKVVYETGPLTSAGFQDAQALPHPAYIQLACIEMFTRSL